MLKIKKILVPTDFSESATGALAPAVTVARTFGAELHLLHGIVLHSWVPPEGAGAFPDLKEVEEAMAEKALEFLDGLERDADCDDLTVVKAERRGTAPAPLILDYAEEEGIDLIVMATHGRRGIRRFLVGSVTEEVVQHAAVPVLTVHPSFEAKEEAEGPLIIAAIDFSEVSRKAATEAADLARRLKGRLELLHVVLRPIHPATYDAFVDVGPDIEELMADARKRLEEMAGEMRQDSLAVETRVRVGGAAQTVADYAESVGCELLVVGSKGLTGVSHFLIGSVAERVVRLATCPVLVLKDDDESSVAQAS